MKLALISILALVLVLGCVGGERPTTISSTEGIIISAFDTTPSATDVLSGDSVIFDVEAENVGGTTAQNVNVVLFGIESQWRETGLDSLVTTSTVKSLGTLRPPQTDRNVPGDFRAAQWEYKTPRIPEGLTTPLNVEARVTYDYNTNGFIQLTAVNDEEYRRQQVTGSTIDQPVIQNSAGPLQLSVPSTEKSSFVIVDTTNGASAEFVYPLKIEFQNVGAGFPIGSETVSGDEDEGKLTGTIKLLGPGVMFSNCLGFNDVTEIDLGLAGQNTESVIVRLRDTQNVPIVCNLKFNTGIWKDRPTDKVNLVFDINYRYFTKQTATVNVIGRRME